MQRFKTSVLILFAIGIAATTRSAYSEPIISLSSPDDLASLIVGQTINVEVHLSGLENNQELDSLAIDILIEDTIFGLPSDPTAGSIVPEAADFDPNSFSDSDLVVGAFFRGDNTATGITANGLFFSFTTQVIAPAVGVIRISSGSALAILAGDQFSPVIEGDPLNFVAEIPEPSISMMLIFGLLLAVSKNPLNLRKCVRSI